MKRIIDSELSEIKFDEKKRDAVMSKIHLMEQGAEEVSKEDSKEVPKGHKRAKRAGRTGKQQMILVAAALCLLLSFAAIAGELPRKFLNLLEPVEYVEPESSYSTVEPDSGNGTVETSMQTSDQRGITLSVDKAIADEDSILILYSLSDPSGQLITENTTVDSYDLSRTSTLGTYLLRYDEESHTAHFLMQGDHGNEMKEKETTLNIHSISQDTSMNLVQSGKTISEMLKDAGERTFSYSDERKCWNAQTENAVPLRELMADRDIPSLSEDNSLSLEFLSISWLTITDAGWKDGWLHIKTENKMEDHDDFNHGYVCLTDKEGDVTSHPVLASSDSDSGELYYIIEAANPDEFEELYLSGFYTNIQESVAGNWSQSFQVKGVETRRWDKVVEADTMNIERFMISPLGVTLSGQGSPSFEQIRLRKKDGTILESVSRMGSQQLDGSSYKFWFEEPLELEEIKEILINDQPMIQVDQGDR